MFKFGGNMEKLSSRQNKIIAHVRKLGSDKAYRYQQGEAVCDGIKLLREALMWGVEITAVLWAEEAAMSLPEGIRQYIVSQELIDYASPLKNSQGALFTFRMPQWNMAEPGRSLVLETVQDPGNLGTILRTANALNMDSVILTGDCADIYNPKTIRAAMGAVFRQKVLRMERKEMKDYLCKWGISLYGAALSDSSRDIRTIGLEKAAVAIGSEGKGLSDELLALCDGQVIIPMNEQCESLNAGVAAAIVMWELTR